MIETDDDLAVFFDTTDFAYECTRKRTGFADVVFAAHLGLEDQDALQRYAVAAQRSLLMPSTIQLYRDDLVEVRDASVTPKLLIGVFKALRDSERTNDGRTATCPLSVP